MSFILNTLSSIYRYLTGASSPSPTVPPIPYPQTCKYRLDNGTSSTITSPDGRKLGYAEWGSPTGKPVLYMHGIPGSRIEASMLHQMGIELGARIIAPDRPGFGWSDFDPKRTLKGTIGDVETLAARLGLEEYGVLGTSGGGPYVLSCARYLPSSKLKCASIICGMGPPDIGMKGADWPHWIGFPYGFRIATVASMRWFFRLDPVAQIELTEEERFRRHMKNMQALTYQKDHEALTDVDFAQVILRGAHEFYTKGFEAVTLDGKIMCWPWEFKVEDIRKDLPVHLWYGKQDCHVPIVHGEQIAKRLGENAEAHFEDETHASIWYNCRREALKRLVETM